MTATEMLGLAAAAMAAGAINAVAGGGTILTFPALLAVGTPSVIANATSTLALVLGTSGSLYGFRRHVGPIVPWLKRLLPVSVLGGLLGSWLLTVTRDETFARLVPFLILFATFLFLVQGMVARRMSRHLTESDHSRRVWPAVLFQFGVAVYGGYFGAGIGILMLATLGFIGLRDIHRMNALKNVLGSLINLVAAGLFVARGMVNWPQAGLMTGGAILGYYLGSHYSQKIPQVWVRRLVLAIGFAISAVTFHRHWG
jgi:uncharacterized membrane protein YfcA